MHLIEPQPVLQRVSALDLADRIGQRGHVANAFAPAAMRGSSNRRRSSFPASMPRAAAACMSCPLAAAMVEASASSASAIACSRAFFFFHLGVGLRQIRLGACGASAFAQTPENTSPFNSSFVIKPRITQIASFAGHSCHHVNMGARVLRPRRTPGSMPVCGTRRRHAHA